MVVVSGITILCFAPLLWVFLTLCVILFSCYRVRLNKNDDARGSSASNGNPGVVQNAMYLTIPQSLSDEAPYMYLRPVTHGPSPPQRVSDVSPYASIPDTNGPSPPQRVSDVLPYLSPVSDGP